MNTCFKGKSYRTNAVKIISKENGVGNFISQCLSVYDDDGWSAEGITFISGEIFSPELKYTGIILIITGRFLHRRITQIKPIP